MRATTLIRACAATGEAFPAFPLRSNAGCEQHEGGPVVLDRLNDFTDFGAIAWVLKAAA